MQIDPAFIGYLLLIGLVVGFLAGLLGIGGGMIMVPPLTLLLASRHFNSGYIIKVAIATALATIFFTSITSVWSHHKRGAVQWPIVLRLAPGIALGTIVMAQFAGLISPTLLSFFFAIFVGYSALKMLLPKRSNQATKKTMPSVFGIFGAGSAIGGLSALVGAGGGFMTVPYLVNRGINMQQAIATSAACGFPIALAGSIGYIIAGWSIDIAPYTLGFLYLPALAGISAASMITAPFGAKVAAQLRVDTLKKIFGIMLLGVAAFMMWRGLST